MKFSSSLATFAAGLMAAIGNVDPLGMFQRRNAFLASLDKARVPSRYRGATSSRRSRIPGPRRPAGAKLTRMAAEHRVGIGR